VHAYVDIERNQNLAERDKNIDSLHLFNLFGSHEMIVTTSFDDDFVADF